ncbi:hypothetical protein FVEN_g2963 [Fusarium venenatum]|nr:hypothetical protein FVEN_g2963 [Fusarium venenatum]
MSTTDPNHDLSEALLAWRVSNDKPPLLQTSLLLTIPPEIQIMIWRLATPPRMHNFWQISDKHDPLFRLRRSTPPPAFWICQQTRSLAKALWKKIEYEVAPSWDTAVDGARPYSYYDPRCDCASIFACEVAKRADPSNNELAMLRLFNHIAVDFECCKRPMY